MESIFKIDFSKLEKNKKRLKNNSIYNYSVHILHDIQGHDKPIDERWELSNFIKVSEIYENTILNINYKIIEFITNKGGVISIKNSNLNLTLLK